VIDSVCADIEILCDHAWVIELAAFFLVAFLLLVVMIWWTEGKNQ